MPANHIYRLCLTTVLAIGLFVFQNACNAEEPEAAPVTNTTEEGQTVVSDQPEEQQVTAEVEAKIRRLIRQLRAEDFRTRSQAETQLVEQDAAAISP